VLRPHVGFVQAQGYDLSIGGGFCFGGNTRCVGLCRLWRLERERVDTIVVLVS